MPALTQLVLEHLANACAFLHHDQRLCRELLERDRLAGEPMVRRACEHDLVVKERLEDDATVATAGADDAELELSVGDPVDDGLRVGDDEPYVDVGVLLLELADEDGDDGAAGAGGGAELERAGDGALFVGGQFLEEVLLGRQEPLCRGVEPLASLGRLHAPPRAVEQLPPEPLLERANLEADGGLGDPEPLSGEREALPVDDGAERGQLTRVHKRSLCKTTRTLRIT